MAAEAPPVQPVAAVAVVVALARPLAAAAAANPAAPQVRFFRMQCEWLLSSLLRAGSGPTTPASNSSSSSSSSSTAGGAILSSSSSSTGPAVTSLACLAFCHSTRCWFVCQFPPTIGDVFTFKSDDVFVGMKVSLPQHRRRALSSLTCLENRTLGTR